MYGLVKIANEQEQNHWGDAALATGGGVATVGAKDRLLGRKTLYHGTSAENAAAIKQEGFKLSDGLGGASESLGEREFIDNSKGKIHLTPNKGFANGFGAIAADPNLRAMSQEVTSLKDTLDANQNASVPASQLMEHFEKAEKISDNLANTRHQAIDRASSLLLRGHVQSPKKYGGETLKMSVPYGDYRAMEVDPDFSPGTNESIARHLAVRTDTPPESRYISGSVDDIGRVGRLKESLRLMPDYVKAHPGRFGTGVGMAGAGLAGMGIAAHNQFND